MEPIKPVVHVKDGGNGFPLACQTIMVCVGALISNLTYTDQVTMFLMPMFGLILQGTACLWFLAIRFGKLLEGNEWIEAIYLLSAAGLGVVALCQVAHLFPGFVIPREVLKLYWLGLYFGGAAFVCFSIYFLVSRTYSSIQERKLDQMSLSTTLGLLICVLCLFSRFPHPYLQLALAGYTTFNLWVFSQYIFLMRRRIVQRGPRQLGCGNHNATPEMREP